MLTSWQKHQAAQIAKILAEEGMLFGEDLEYYLKLDELNALYRLSDNDRDAFIDEIISMVEFNWRKAIAVYDIKENNTKIFIDAEQAANELNTTKANVYTSKRINSKVNDRYIVSIFKPKIKELEIGLKALSSQPRKGYFLTI